MKKFRDTSFAWTIFIIGLVVISAVFYIMDSEKKILDYIAYFGTYLSIFGLIITFSQILSVKEISEETAKKIEESMLKTFKLLSVAEISRSIQLIQEIQNYLRYDRLEAALIRMKDLKNSIIQLKQNENFSSVLNNQKYKSHLTNLSIETINVNQHISGTKIGINKNKIIGSLEEFENFLVEIEGKLKFKI